MHVWTAMTAVIMAHVLRNVKNLFLLQVAALFSYVFITSGLVVSALSLPLLIIWPFSEYVYRRVISGLAYTVIGQMVWFCTDYADLKIEVFGTKETYDKLGKEHQIITSSHRGNLDWVAGYVVGARYGFMHSIRSLPKRSVLFIPGFGQLLWALEYPFLHRKNYQKDKETISNITKAYKSYPFPIQVAIYCEGTRFTQEKHKKGLEYAKKNNLPPLKHHLTPRTKGFALLAEHLRESDFKAVYDIAVSYPEYTGDDTPSHLDVLLGKKIIIQWYMRRIPMEDLPTSHEELNTFCYQLYQQKDEAYEYFLKNGEFPAPRQPLPPFEGVLQRLRVIMVTWGLLLIVVPMVILYFTLTLQALSLVLAGFLFFNSLVFVVLVIYGRRSTGEKKD